MTDNKTETIEIHLSNEELVTCALLAHEEDITLNQWMVNACIKYIGGTDGHTTKDEGDS